jgi:hypothetical protein
MKRWLTPLLVVLLLLGGCGGSDDADDELLEEVLERSGDLDNVEIDTEDDSISFSVEGEDGDQSFSIGGDIPDGFPMPVPDDYSVASSMSFDEGGAKAYAVTLEIDSGDFDDAVALYEDFLADEGFEVSRTETTADGGRTVYLGGEREDVTAAAIVAADEDGAFVSLNWGPSG